MPRVESCASSPAPCQAQMAGGCLWGGDLPRPLGPPPFQTMGPFLDDHDGTLYFSTCTMQAGHLLRCPRPCRSPLLITKANTRCSHAK